MIDCETATQTLHRLTAMEVGREWDRPVDDPRILQGFETNDLTRFPWFFKRYAQPLPRLLRPLGCPDDPGGEVEQPGQVRQVQLSRCDLGGTRKHGDGRGGRGR